METPQNKFLDNVYHLASETNSTFVLANAKLSFFPIIYCSRGFFEDVGHTRNEVTTKDVYLRFMCGRQTDKKALKEYDKGVKNKEITQVEIILYSKGGTKRWYLVTLIPVKDDDDEIGIFLVLFNYISHIKEYIPDSPRRLWTIATRRALNKPSLEYFRKHIDEKKDKERKGKLDKSTIKGKIKNSFIPVYGLTKPQVPKFLIHHSNTAKIVWDSFILLCILYTSVVVPFFVAFNYSKFEVVIFDTFVDLMFFIDIIITFFTTYINSAGELVVSGKLIRRNYIRGWFLLDCVAALPYSVITFTFNNSNLLEILSFLKILRLIRLGKVGKKISRYMQMSAVTLGVWLLVFCLCAHWMACIWYAIAARLDEPFKTKHSWLSLLADVTGRPYNFTSTGEIIEGSGPTIASCYISALYYTMSSLTTCGFGNIAPNTSAEKFFGCVTMLLGCVLYALIFGQVTNIISQMQKGSNEFTDRLTSIKNFNRIYKMPPHVAKRLEDYFTATWAVTKGTDEEEIMKPCPRDLQSDLCLNIHKVVFDSNHAFKHLSDSALRALSRYFWTIRTAPGDKLINTNETVDTIYFVATGSLEVYSNQDLTGLIGPADAWGKSLLDEDETLSSVYDVLACSYGAIHCISCNDVRSALELYPEEYDKIKYDLVLSFDITRQVETVTKTGEIISTEVKKEILNTPQGPEINTYVPGDDITALEHQINTNSDVLSGMSELKGELRRETERMNAKMGVVEAQMRLVLKMLRRNNKIDLDPEIGLQLDELMTYEGGSQGGQDDGEEFEWFVADSHGWKQPPSSAEKPNTANQLNSKVVLSKPPPHAQTTNKPTTPAQLKRTSSKPLAHTVVDIKKSPKENKQPPLQPSSNNSNNNTAKTKQSSSQVPSKPATKTTAANAKNAPKKNNSSVRSGAQLMNEGYENEETIETIHL